MRRRPGRPAIVLAWAAALAVGLAATAAAAQAVATGAGRTDELSEAAHVDAYLADAARAPAAAGAQRQVTPSEAAASATAFPPMAADSPWARGVTGPDAGPSSLAAADAREARPCDHRMHGEVGAEIGTGGTRGGYGVASIPVGKDCQGQVTVGVSSYRGRGYGGYGYGSYRYSGRFATRPADHTAFSLGFSATSEDGRGPGRAEDRAPGPPGWGPPAF